MPVHSSTPISSKEDGWTQKNFHLEFAFKWSKSSQEVEKTAFYLNKWQNPVQTMEEQDPA